MSNEEINEGLSNIKNREYFEPFHFAERKDKIATETTGQIHSVIGIIFII